MPVAVRGLAQETGERSRLACHGVNTGSPLDGIAAVLVAHRRA
jgi:hypothetical protein